jgi:ribosomal protein S18 acetylase RimI-like enzyme
MTNTSVPQFHPLSNVSLITLADTFTQAFAGYFVPMHMTATALADKIMLENIDLSRSVGCFQDGMLTGFILTGIDTINNRTYAYNAGTGVLPAYRGRQITKAMYRHLIAALKREGITQHILEVMKENARAIKVYEHSGFSISRSFHCHKGKFAGTVPANAFEIREVLFDQLAEFTAHLDTLPTWQNATAALQRSGAYTLLGCWMDGTLAGYLAVDVQTGKLRQFAVKKQYRRKGIASALFGHAQSLIGDKDILITYVEIKNTAAVSFLEQGGIHKFIDVLEMTAAF